MRLGVERGYEGELERRGRVSPALARHNSGNSEILTLLKCLKIAQTAIFTAISTIFGCFHYMWLG